MRGKRHETYQNDTQTSMDARSTNTGTNIKKVQVFHKETLRLITGAPLATEISQIHPYTEMPYVYEAIGEATTAQEDRLEEHDKTITIN